MPTSAPKVNNTKLRGDVGIAPYFFLIFCKIFPVYASNGCKEVST